MKRQYTSALIAFLSISLITIANAQEPASVDAKLIKPFVGETTCLILKLDPSRIELPDGTDSLTSTPEAKAAIAEGLQTVQAALNQLRTLAGDQPIFATAGIPISQQRVPVYLFQQKTSDAGAAKLVESVGSSPIFDAQIHGEYVVAVPRDISEDFPFTTPPTTLKSLEAALETVASYPVYLIAVPPEHVWRTVRELLPELPHQLGGGPSQVLTDVQWLAMGIDPKNLRIEVIIQSTDDQAARNLAAHLPVLFRSAHKAALTIQERDPQNLAKLLIDCLQPQADGSRVTIRMDGLEKTSNTVKLFAGVARHLHEQVRRDENQNRFREILLGIHNFHDTYRSVPPTDKHRGDDGKPRLSWRVHILPFVEQQALYDQFHLDEPWDSPHNKTLLEKMPDIYRGNSLARASLKPGYTTFLAPVGKQTIFGGASASKFSQITDGLSNTIAVVEVAPEKSVPWTSPDDFPFDPQDPLGGIVIGPHGTWICAFADGSVHHLSSGLDPSAVLHLFQMNDGHVVELD